MKKVCAILLVVSVVMLISVTVALAVGDILTTSGVTWVNPPGNYVYNVTTNPLTPPSKLCLQYRTDKGSGWQWYYEDLCTGGTENWICTIPGPLTSGYNYQWYIKDDGDCTIVDGGRDWTPTDPAWQPTNPVTAITLSSLTAASALPAAFPWLAGAVIALGGMLAWRRKRG